MIWAPGLARTVSPIAFTIPSRRMGSAISDRFAELRKRRQCARSPKTAAPSGSQWHDMTSKTSDPRWTDCDSTCTVARSQATSSPSSQILRSSRSTAAECTVSAALRLG